jgi:hypothetical protein
MARLTRKQIREGLEQTPIDALILPNPTETRLTAKQREFARLVALGETKAQSYRTAYKSKGNSKTAADNGHKLSKHTGIKQAVEVFAEAKRFADSHTAEQLRAFVVQQLVKHASDDDVPPAVRVQALRLIGQHSGVDSFITRSEVIHTKSSGDIKARIMDKLKLIGASTTIEANSVQDDSQDADSLLKELTPPPVETLETDDHPGGDPLNRPGDAGPHTHIIPHNQSSDFSDQPEISDADWIDSPSMSTTADDKPLPSGNMAAETDSETSLTCNVSSEKFSDE